MKISKTVRCFVLLGLLFVAAHAAENEKPEKSGKPEKSEDRPPSNKGTQQSGMSSETEAKRPPKGEKPRIDKQGDKMQKKFQLSAGGFNIEANGNGNTPFFRYWADGKPQTKIQFLRMYQTASLPSNSTKRLRKVSLVGAYNWEMTDATSVNGTTNTTSELIFNLTGTPKSAGNSDKPKPDIVFVNHLISNQNGTEFKFDVHITKFASDWWATEAQYLVTAYKINQLGVSDDTLRNYSLADARVQRDAQRPSKPKGTSRDDVTVQIAVELGDNNGLEVAGTATGGTTGTTIEVSVTMENAQQDEEPEERGNYVLICYKRFDTELHHDPRAYTQTTSSASINSVTSQTLFNADGTVAFNNGATVGTTGTPSATPSAASGLIANLALRMSSAFTLIALAASLF